MVKTQDGDLAIKAHKYIMDKYKVHKFDLMEHLGISINRYNQLKPFIEYKLADYVTYHKDSKSWFADGIKAQEESRRLSQEEVKRAKEIVEAKNNA